MKEKEWDGEGLVWPPVALVTGLLSSHARSGRAGPGALRFQLMAESLLFEARASFQVPRSLRLAVTGEPITQDKPEPKPHTLACPSPIPCYLH